MNAKTLIRSAAALCATVCVAATTGRAAVLLDDQFTDGERATQSLPTSAQWFIASSNSSMRSGFGVVNQMLSVPQLVTGTNASEIAYFTAAGSPQGLSVGDKLSLSFNVAFDYIRNSDRGFRVGLFNSNNSRLTADSTSQETTATDVSQGYTFDVNPATLATQITERRSGSNSIIFGGTVTSLGATTASGTAPAADAPFAVSLTLTRTAGGITIDGLFAGKSVSASDLFGGGDGTIFSAFDTLALFENTTVATSGAAVSGAVTFDDVLVTYTPVPEPAGLAALGLIAAGVLARGRHRASD